MSSSTATDSSAFRLRLRQISVLERLFHKPIPVDFTVAELTTALDFFGLTIEATTRGGKVLFAKPGQNPTVVTFGRPTSDNKGMDPQAVRQIATTLVSQGFVTGEMRQSFTLHPSYKARPATDIHSSNPVSTDATIRRINKSNYVLPNSYLGLLDPEHRNALCLRLAQAAVIFYGKVEEGEKSRQVEASLARNPDLKNDLLFLCRLWRLEEGCPSLRHHGMPAHFEIPFSAQNTGQVTRFLRTHILGVLPATENGKLNKLADRIKLDLAQVETSTAKLEQRPAASGKFAPPPARGKNGGRRTIPNRRYVPPPPPKPPAEAVDTSLEDVVKYEPIEVGRLDCSLQTPPTVATWGGMYVSTFLTLVFASMAKDLTLDPIEPNYVVGLSMCLMTIIWASATADHMRKIISGRDNQRLI